MTNTIENKARFFAQYWGQNVMNYNGKIYYPSYFIRTQAVKESFLELTPLSQISDEDAIEAAKIVCPEMFIGVECSHEIERQFEWMTVSHKKKILSVDIDYLGYTTCQNEDVEYLRNNTGNTHAIDFLRSRGYALPWLGISVNQQVEWGWVKLKEVKP